MVYDARHALDHPEVAGWALGALDPDDMPAFEEHLRSCEQCQAQVAEFTPVAKSLALAAPAAEPPAGLELKVVAAVQYAAMAESAATSTAAPAPTTVAQAEPKPNSSAKAHRWWHLHWTNPLYAALAAAAVTAAAFLGSTLFQTARRLRQRSSSPPSQVLLAQAWLLPATPPVASKYVSLSGTYLSKAQGSSMNAGMRGRTTARVTPNSSRREPSSSTAPAVRLSTCGAPPTRPSLRSCRSLLSSQEMPASTAKSFSLAPPRRKTTTHRAHLRRASMYRPKPRTGPTRTRGLGCR